MALLQDRFDDKFRYDENGLPKLYLNEQDLEKTFAVAKQHALQVLPILTFAKLADGSEIVPDYDIFDSKLREQFLGATTIVMMRKITVLPRSLPSKRNWKFWLSSRRKSMPSTLRQNVRLFSISRKSHTIFI